MSYNWDNVTWQSRDGSWNRGYFKRISMADSPDSWREPELGYDSEWDDEFDGSQFESVGTGFSTLEAARDFHSPSGNPGSSSEVPYRGNARACKALDLMAFHHTHPEAKAKHDRKIHNRKRREHFAKLEKKWAEEKLGGKRLRVELKEDEEVYSRYGCTQVLEGLTTQDGDWLMLEGKRVRNLKTGKFHNRVHSASASVRYAGRW